MTATDLPFDPDEILHDSFLSRASSFDVQGFLEKLGSKLASLRLSGVLVSETIEQVASATPIDARVLLTKLQVEQSLLTTDPTPEKLDWAMGYGATDDGRMDEYRDFGTQVRMAAKSLTGYLDSHHPFTVVGLVGKPMNVRDGLVVPKNLATAALYRYTPWIGSRPFNGMKPPFGNYLFFVVWKQLFHTDPRQPVEPVAGDPPWKLIVPQDNWRHPIDASDATVEAMGEVAGRLGLVVTRDAARRKLFLGLPRPEAPAPASPPADGHQVQYPSGLKLEVVAPPPGEAGRYAPAVPSRAAPLVAADAKAQLSQHFALGEFLPKDPSYVYVRVSPKLVAMLERIRDAMGGLPLVITSGYRPPAYNRAVGGVPNSTHADGLAADIYSTHFPVHTLWETADRLVADSGGVGYYPTQGFVHVDVRGTRARWNQ